LLTVQGSLELAYDDVGTGQPVVLIHAFPLNRTMWAPQVSALVERCRCVAPDLRGFGETTAAPPYTMRQYADDIARLLDQLRIETTVLGGCSMGGYVALEFWRRHRDRVRALVLVDTRAGADDDAGRIRRREMIGIAEDQGATAIANLQISGIVGKTTREKQPDTYDAVHRMIAQSRVEGIVGGLQAMMARPDSTVTLATITVPTLIVVGEEDVLTPPGEARAMHAAIAGSRLEIIADAGHLSSLERPAAFNHVLTEFLSALSYS
jgi:3-oxoadipate enol-lactonase